jgi:predicted transcriptional regulator
VAVFATHDAADGMLITQRRPGATRQDRLTVSLDPDLIESVRELAARYKASQSAVVADAIRDYRKAERQRRTDRALQASGDADVRFVELPSLDD